MWSPVHYMNSANHESEKKLRKKYEECVVICYCEKKVWKAVK